MKFMILFEGIANPMFCHPRSIAVLTPTMFPMESNRGHPLFPELMDALVCIAPESTS